MNTPEHPVARSGRRAAARGLGPSGWWPPGAGPRRSSRGRGPRGSTGHGHVPGPKHHRPGRGGGPGGEILFWAFAQHAAEPTPQEDIFAIDTATGAVRRLTDHSSGVPFVSDRDPAWSPARDRLVFMSARADEPTHLAVLSAAGLPVADLAVEGGAPSWMDPTTVLCHVWRDGPAGSMDRSDLVAVSVPAGAVRPVVTTVSGEWLTEPVWHPSGGLVATLTRTDPVTAEEVGRLVHAPAAAVAAVLAGGAPLSTAGLGELAPGHLWPSNPAWSPEGGRVAFAAARPSATSHPGGRPVLQSDIAVLTVATGAVEWVTDDTRAQYAHGILDGSPSFSPDGEWLAWARGHEDDEDAGNRIVMKRLGDRRPPIVLTDDWDWWRWGLHW